MQIPWLNLSTGHRNVPWLRWLIILAALGLSFLAYPLSQRLPLFFLFGAVAALIFALIAVRDMPLALTILLLTSATTGITLSTGTASPLPLGLLAMFALVAIWLLRMLVQDRRISLKRSPVNLPWLAFLVASLVSWIAGYALWDWRLPVQKNNLLFIQAGQYALFLLSFAAAFLTAHLKLSETHLKRWSLIIILIGFGGMFFELMSGSFSLRGQGLTGAVLIWAVVLVAAQLLFNPDQKGWMRIFMIVALIFWLVWAFNNLSWKGGWLPAMMALFILLFIKDWKLFLIVLFMVGLVSLLQYDVMVDLFFSSESASRYRPYMWLDIIRLTTRSPLIGLGLANYIFYWYTPGFVPLSRLEAGWDAWNAWGYSPPSHNMFVDIFAQTGIIGFVIFIWGMLAALWLLWVTFKRFQPGFMRAYLVAIFSGFSVMLAASFLFADWLIPFVYNITLTGFRHSVYTWILLGSGLGVYYRLQDKQSGSES